MFSKISGSYYRTAAWRLALRSTIVFAVSSAAVFMVMYFFVARAIRDRTDSWLIGESETLKRVALTAPHDVLYDRIVEEVAELASQEVAYGAHGDRTNENIVFFLKTDDSEQPEIWVGPANKSQFVTAVEKHNIRQKSPVFIWIGGWPEPFRVVVIDIGPGAGRIYLGLHDTSAATMFKRLFRRFFFGWVAMVVFGFAIAMLALRRTLKRVDDITTAATNIGTGDLSSRVATGAQNDEIGRLAKTFNHMLDRISASVNQLRTLTDAVAHDMKSPITSVRASLEVALSIEDEVASRELVAEAIEHLDRLSNIITTSLDVAEADAGALRLRMETVDLADLANRVSELYAPVFAERGQTLETQTPHPAIAQVDARLFNRLFSNLMENELRYAGRGAHVTFRVIAVDKAVHAEIEDDGPGFATDFLPNIFQRFARGSQSEGHGLGLAFVKAVACAHGGNASAGNRSPLRGAYVSVTIPMHAELPSNIHSDDSPEFQGTLS